MLSEKIKSAVPNSLPKPSAGTCVKLSGGISSYNMLKLKLQGIDEDNIYVYENIPLSEYRKIANKETFETFKLVAEIVLACAALAGIGVYAFTR